MFPVLDFVILIMKREVQQPTKPRQDKLSTVLPDFF